MRNKWMAGLLLLGLCGSAFAAPSPGFIGHPACKAYFRAAWMQNPTSISFGLTAEQVKWWVKHQKDFPGLCYSDGSSDPPRPWFWFTFSSADDRWSERRMRTTSDTSQKEVPITGTLNDQYGQKIGDIEGTTTQTTTTTVTRPVSIPITSHSTKVAVYNFDQMIAMPTEDKGLFYRMEVKQVNHGGGMPTLIGMAYSGLHNLENKTLKDAALYVKTYRMDTEAKKP